jgi:hypothetical protein
MALVAPAVGKVTTNVALEVLSAPKSKTDTALSDLLLL